MCRMGLARGSASHALPVVRQDIVKKLFAQRKDDSALVRALITVDTAIFECIHHLRVYPHHHRRIATIIAISPSSHCYLFHASSHAPAIVNSAAGPVRLA